MGNPAKPPGGGLTRGGVLFRRQGGDPGFYGFSQQSFFCQ
jgi:hypothetical protein